MNMNVHVYCKFLIAIFNIWTLLKVKYTLLIYFQLCIVDYSRRYHQYNMVFYVQSYFQHI